MSPGRRMGTQVRGPATAHDPLQEYGQLNGHGASDFVRVQDLLDRNQCVGGGRRAASARGADRLRGRRDILAEVNRSVQMGHYGDQTAQSRLMQGEWHWRERPSERPGAAAAAC